MTATIIGVAVDAEEQEWDAEVEEEEDCAFAPLLSTPTTDDDDSNDDVPPRQGRSAMWVCLVVLPAAAILGLIASSYREVLRRGEALPLPPPSDPTFPTTLVANPKSSAPSSPTNFTAPQASAAPSASPLRPSAVVIGNESEHVHDDDVVTPWQSNGLCRRDQIIDGKWVPVRLREPPYRPPSNDTRCRRLHDPSYYASQRKGGGMWDTYQWVPNDSDAAATHNNSTSTSTPPCHFTAWNATLFCEVAQYATVLIVGDSLSWENYASLALLAGASPVHHGFQRMSWHSQTNIGHAVCNGTTRLVYRRDDYLDTIRDALLESETTNNLPQVVVLNRGAHYVNDTELLAGIRSTLDAVDLWLDRCDQLKIKCHFFWRTTVPGHRDCRSFKAPVNDKARMEKHVADMAQYSRSQITFHWYDFQHQNLLVEAELKRRKVPHQILDGYHINLLRPDGHNDCLHSCYPGKMDVYSQLLLHYLRGDRTLKDVQKLQSVHDDLGWNLNVTTEYDGTP